MSVNQLERFLGTVHSGRLAIGCVITFSDPAVTELAADTGLDFVWIDGEHGEMDRNTAMMHMMAVRGTNCASFYRVPCCDHTEIKKIIDFAPAGVIVPMIMDENDAAKAVAACRYPLAGNRGCGMRRQHRYGAVPVDDTFYAQAQKEPLVILQIEHIRAVENLDRILAVPGIDSLMIGPYDLSFSMGKPGQFRNPEVMAAIDTVCQKCRAADKLLGAYAEGDFDLWAKRGLHYIASANDTGVLASGLHAMQKRLRDSFQY